MYEFGKKNCKKLKIQIDITSICDASRGQKLLLMLFLDCMNMCGSFRLLICYICTCSSRFVALFLSKMIISPYIYSKYTWFLLQFERVFVENAKRYEISDFRSWLYVSMRVFWHKFWNFATKISKSDQSPTLCNSEMPKVKPNLTSPIDAPWKVVYMHSRSANEIDALSLPPELCRYA